MKNKSPDETKKIVEALLFAVHEPISAHKIIDAEEGTDTKQIKEIIQQLRE